LSSGNDIAIKVENLSKAYKLYNKPVDRMKESLHPLRKKYHHDFYALNDVSFEVKKGETVGIIGKNGSGKSTLLKIITGVLTPTSGIVQVNGKVSALLELGAGFNPEFTGVENVYFNGSIMGYTRTEMDEKIDNILSFADIGEFANQPVKTYSSGMFVRLAFSLATMVNPEILIVDEALSVGDMFFQAKSISRMKMLIENEGTTLLFVSHDTGSLKSICKKGLLLNNGGVIAYSDSLSVVEKYYAVAQGNLKDYSLEIIDDVDIKTENNDFEKLNDNLDVFNNISKFQRIGNFKAKFLNVQLIDKNNKVLNTVMFNETIILRMYSKFFYSQNNIVFVYHIINKNGINIVYNDSYIEKGEFLNYKKDDIVVFDWEMKCSLAAGDYTVLVAISIVYNNNSGEVEYCDYIPIAYQFKVLERKESLIYGAVYNKNIITETVIDKNNF